MSPSERAQHPLIELLIRFYLYVKIFNIKAKTDNLSGMKKDLIDDLQDDWINSKRPN
jgi:hypothetical protein